MKPLKRIGIVAHDNRKKDIMEWVEWNKEVLSQHKLICTGTTGRLVEEMMTKDLKKGQRLQHEIVKLKSGPLGGDQQMGSMIVNGDIDMFIFFWDPMQAQPHDVDVKALLRITVLYNIPTACNRSSADFMISSELMNRDYVPFVKDYSSYINRNID